MNKTLLLATLALMVGCGEAVDTEPPVREVAPVRVKAALPQVRDIEYKLVALGSIESIQHPTVSAETNGQILSIDSTEGSKVTADQLLATIDDTLHTIEAQRNKAELKRQEVLLKNQRRVVQRLSQLAKSQSVSEDQLEDQQAQLAMLEAQRDSVNMQWEHASYLVSKTRILSPQTGRVSRRHVSIGDYVTVGTPLFDLTSIDRLQARLAFPEHEANRIQIGKAVTLTTPTAPGVVANGTVRGIIPQINVVNRSMEITVDFPNPGGWLPGASTDATLIFDLHPDAITLPLTSIAVRNGRDVVFILKEDQVIATPIITGWREVDWVEILEGVSANDSVVVEGASQLSHGSRVSLGD